MSFPAARPWAVPLAGLALALAAWAVFGQVQQHDYVDFDDLLYVAGNPHLHEPLDTQWVLHELQHVHHAYWIPLTWLSYRVDVALFGGGAPVHLLVNVALHLANTLLLWAALGWLSGARWRSFAVAALFLLHPLHVESVAWVTERKDVLAGFFYLLAIVAYAWQVRGRGGVRAEITVFLGMALGLMAKPMLVTLPLSLLLLDHWPLRRLGNWRQRLLEKLPLFGLSLGGALVVLATQARGGGRDFAQYLDLPLRLANALHSLGQYLWDAVWPAGLIAIYPHPTTFPPAGEVLLAAGALALLVALAWRGRHSRPWWSFGVAWFLVNLAPVLGIVGVGMQARADRWMYLPLVGLGVAVLWELHHQLARRPQLAGLGAGVVAVALLALGVRAHDQVGVWRDTPTLFRHAIAVDEGNWYAHHRLAVYHRQRSEFEAASHHYGRTLVAMPDFAYAAGEWGEVLVERERPADGAALLQLAGETGFGRDDAALALGLALVDAHEDSFAAAVLSRAGGDPSSIRAGRAVLAARAGDGAQAAELASRAVDPAPRQSRAVRQLAWLLATSGDGALRDPGEAASLLPRLVALGEDDPRALDTRAAVMAATGEFATAVRLGRAAARLAGERGWHDEAYLMQRRVLGYLQGQAHVQRGSV